ncbi:MAG: hypothetical protein IT377_13950 [Polyangiaceae bacterium]|nr:hypothetical protein [Myxococcales bacterium]MCC6900078.1 hypothetical protein [Polyangiaceae bacterium]
MEPVVDLALGADHVPLARQIAERVRTAISQPALRRDFDRMRGAVGIVADDADTALTLRFDFGRLTIHEGLIGVPTVTLRGITRGLDALSELPAVPARGLVDSGRSLAHVLGALRAGKLKIYGLTSHPRLVFRLLRLLSVEPR